METAFGVESPLYVAIRATLSLCSVGLLGALALRLVVLPRYGGPDGEALRVSIDTRLPKWISAFALTAIGATLARLAAQHVAVFGAEERVSIDTLTTLLFRAGWGKTWWVALVGAFAVTWLARRLKNRASTAWAPMTAAVLAFAASQPWTGHAAAAEGPLAARAMQILHVIGAGGWVGGLAALTLVAIPAARSLADTGAPAADARIAALVRAFSPTALAFAAVLAATGAIAAWRNLGGVAPLAESAYGRTLLLKLSLLAIVAGVGAYNWRRVLPTLGEAQSSARLRRSSFIELGAAVVVLIVTAVLVATPMPGE